MKRLKRIIIANIVCGLIGAGIIVLGVTLISWIGAAGGMAVMAVGGLIVLGSGTRVFWLVMRPGGRAEEDPASRVCLRCGYDMRHLQVPRCPECGALVGFDKSAGELGITEHELRRGDREASATQ